MADPLASTSTIAADTSPSATAAPRESQVQNAVAFLSHPKVQASSVAAKRAFLERKGLTAAEIDEAFRRVPGSAPEPAAAPAPSTSAPAPAPSGYAAGGPGTPGHPVAHPPTASAAPATPVRWTQVLLGAGVVASSAWAVHHYAAPYVTSLYHRWFSPGPDSPKQDAEPTPEQAALAAASQELRESVEALGQVSKAMQQALEAQQAPGEVAELLRQELRDMGIMLRTALQARQQPTWGPQTEKAEMMRELEWLKASIRPDSSPGAFPGGAGGPGSQQPGSGGGLSAHPGSVPSAPGSVNGDLGL